MRIRYFCVALVVAFLFVAAVGASDAPLVSVIIPTHQRPVFLAHALELIRTQDYPNIEVVVVDDSSEPLSSDFVQQTGIRYVYLTERKTIGEKRNIAVANAKGEVIVHWDDDDFFRSHRISAQVKPIFDGETDMTVLEHHFYLIASAKEFFTVKRASSWGPHFATFTYRRSIFEAGLRYPDNSMAEDYAFAESALDRGYTIKVMQNFDGKHIYVRHANTWQIDFAKYDAQVTEVEKPEFISQKDVDFYAEASAHSTRSLPPNNYASDKIRWDREELRPLDRETRASIRDSPGYPHYETFSYNTGGQIITIPLAAIIIGLTILGTLYIFYVQRKNTQFEQVGGYQPLNQFEDSRLGAGPSKGYGSV